MAAPGLELTTPIQFLNGVGPARASALEKAGVRTIWDLLYYFPRRHLDRTAITTIPNLKKDFWFTVIGKIGVCGERRTRRGRMFEAVLFDGSGSMNLVWFNGVDYISKSITRGDYLAVHGKVEDYKGKQMVHPEYDHIREEDNPLHSGAVIPIYPSSQELKKVGLDGRGFRRIVRNMLDSLPEVEDHFPPELLKQHNLIGLDEAVRQVHFAQDPDLLNRSVRRLKFDEHFYLQLLMALKREKNIRIGTTPLTGDSPQAEQIRKQLEFGLTAAQERVLKEISRALTKDKPMNRLLQGDVGSGKTIVAVLTAAGAVDNKVQVAVMAPTEILAQQHFHSFKKFTERININCTLLVGKIPTTERKNILEKVKSGEVDILIGTHALIQKDVIFNNLGLVIVDEQHRFGVVQRGDLTSKGWNPHFLAMTATPIPRTLAITYFGDMDISIIDEMPKDRKPVATKVVGPERLDKVYQFVRDEIQQRRQCMVVYPLVEESEKSDLAAAVEGHEQLSKTVFSDFGVGLVHGRMKREEKDEIMSRFGKGEIPILVSTTVIEVGIDVPNATVMVVEHADRFGLTQLHQLRGRVGRGSQKSYCILIQRKATENGRRRLEIMEQTNDGFEISDEDLKMRGPGEFFGMRQSGFIRYRIADMVADGSLIREARQAAFELVEKDSILSQDKHQLIRLRFEAEYSDLLETAGIS